MGRRRALLTALAVAAAVTTGCASKAEPSAAPVAVAPAAATPGSAAPATPSPAAAPADTEIPDGYDGTRDAAADIKAALALSATDHRQVLLDFGADWCPDCHVLDKLFRAGQVAPLLHGDYRVVAVDVGQFDHNLDLAARYVDLQRSGIPALVVLAPDGTVRTATNDGSFSNARSMDAAGVAAFLKRWSAK
ncbi:thioredoxin family protein [Kitasatospora arboriphila]|uniref:Thioredoxin domain-containing protein n=1 Tax=Kitasatospora arboriphila TaxID=258052 RepID=A0ABP4EFF7_9ACTN